MTEEKTKQSNSNTSSLIFSKISEDEEKKETLKLFKENLVNILKMNQPEDSELILDYNITLIRMLLEDEDFKNDLSKALLNNQEKLTFKKFELDGKLKRPTIANWLKDFIKEYGAEIFDNLTLARYITDSKNTRLLNKEERQRLRKLLELYRNLKFFPESMKERIMGDWEIIPVEKKEKLEKIKAEKVKIPKSKEEQELEELRKLAKQYVEGSLEKRAIEEEIERRYKLES